MSYILDALRKSEQERRQTETPVLTQPLADIQLPRRELSVWLGIAIGALGLVAGLVGWMLFLRQPMPPQGGQTLVTAPISVAPVAPAPTPSEAVVEPAAPAIRAAPELKAHPLVSTAETAPAVRDLAEEAQVEARTPKAPKPATREPQVPAMAAAAPTTSQRVTAEPIKFLRSMPPDFQQALPELVVNIHIYAPRAADRILYINNRQYHAGDRVRNDIRVEEIVEDGAVLSFRGERFKLPRPR